MFHICDNVWRYAGVLELNKSKSSKRTYLRAKSKWPEIIPEEIAKAVEDARKQRGQHRRASTSVHRFSLLVYCGECGRRMGAVSNTTRNRRDSSKVYNVELYKCRNGEGYATHSHSNISAKFIDAAVRDAIEFVKDKKNRELIIGSQASQAEAVKRTIHQIEERIAKNRAALQRADDQFVDGTMDMERYKRQLARLSEQWESLQKELMAEHQKLEKEYFDSERSQRLVEIAETGIAMLETDDIAMANAWFLRHFRIEIHNQSQERVLVFYI